MKTHYNKFDLQRQLNFLENNVNLSLINPQYLFNVLENYFHSIPVGVTFVKKGFKLYRGRVHSGGSSYKNVDDFSYVKHDDKKKCTKYGRANLPTQSLFYSSNNMDTAQMECITKDVQNKIWFLSFGEWEVQEDLIIADIILHDIEEVRLTTIGQKREHTLNLIKNELDDEQFECNKMILDFFGKQFSKTKIPSHEHYLYSVYLTNRLFDLTIEGKPIDGIQYPSVPMIYQGYNIVLQPSVIDSKKIKLIKTYELICGIGGGMKLQSKIENTSKDIIKNEIIWNKNDCIFYPNNCSNL